MPVQKGNLYLALTSTASSGSETSIYGTVSVKSIALYGAFDISDKFSLNLNVPYVNSKPTDDYNTKKGSGLGDISVGLKYQIIDQKETFADIFFNLTAISATGNSPYEIDPNRKLPTGSGGYSLKPEIAITKKFMNSAPFCSIFYQHNLKIDDLSYHQSPYDGEMAVFLNEVEPGDEYGVSIGFFELINKNISILLRYDYHKAESISYNWVNRDDYESGSMDFSKVETEFGIKLPSKLSVFTKFSVGVGDEAPDYELGISVAL